jgi:hypothetical protein
LFVKNFLVSNLIWKAPSASTINLRTPSNFWLLI